MKHLVTICLILLLLTSTRALAIHLQGGEHTIDYDAVDLHVVMHNDTFWNTPATLNIVTGAVLIQATIDTYNESLVNISGGDFSGSLYLRDSSVATFYGSDFTINGQPALGTFIGNGPGTKRYGSLIGESGDGGWVNIYLELCDNASLTFAPEPATILLLGLGSLVLVRCKHKRIGSS